MAAVGGFTGGERDALEVMNHESKAGNMLRGGRARLGKLLLYGFMIAEDQP